MNKASISCFTQGAFDPMEGPNIPESWWWYRMCRAVIRLLDPRKQGSYSRRGKEGSFPFLPASGNPIEGRGKVNVCNREGSFINETPQDLELKETHKGLIWPTLCCPLCHSWRLGTGHHSWFQHLWWQGAHDNHGRLQWTCGFPLALAFPGRLSTWHPHQVDHLTGPDKFQMPQGQALS